MYLCYPTSRNHGWKQILSHNKEELSKDVSHSTVEQTASGPNLPQICWSMLSDDKNAKRNKWDTCSQILVNCKCLSPPSVYTSFSSLYSQWHENYLFTPNKLLSRRKLNVPNQIYVNVMLNKSCISSEIAHVTTLYALEQICWTNMLNRNPQEVKTKWINKPVSTSNGRGQLCRNSQPWCAGRDREKLTAIKEPLALESHAQTLSRPVLQMLATCSYLS